MSAPDIESEYRRRLTTRRTAHAALERRHVLFSRVRLALIVLALLVIVTLQELSLPWLAAIAVAFVGVAATHARTLAARERARRAVVWYERGLDRLDHAWVGNGDAGERFRPSEHRYADDLDLFGRGSLFQLLSTPRTPGGLETLAAWLLEPAAPAVIAERQAAVRELSGQLDLREALAVAGEGVNVRASSLREWAVSPTLLTSAALAAGLALLSSVTISLMIAYLEFKRFGVASLAMFAVQALVALVLLRRVHAINEAVERPSRDLTVLAEVMRVFERASFTAPALQHLTAALQGTGRPASEEIAHLERLASRIEWRDNLVFALPALLMFWKTQCAIAIDRWRARVGRRVPGWLTAVAELEALAALATLAAEHPRYVYPEFEDAPAHLAAAGCAHPLLPTSAVANDVMLGGGAADILVVSGSNMSGKSTFLRALGVNVVLAHAGGPVRASSFRLSSLQVGASIRTLDSLQDGRSRFFAEITRLKLIVDLTRRHPGGVLFLLDEILAGTNSHDRAHGAGALFDGLLATGAIGLATTHDLALSQLAVARAPRASNVHFADQFDAGGLAFDYRLRPGPVKTSNALVLMRSIGLDV